MLEYGLYMIELVLTHRPSLRSLLMVWCTDIISKMPENGYFGGEMAISERAKMLELISMHQAINKQYT